MENNQAKPMEIKIADNMPGGEYSNAMQVVFNKDEFTLPFFNLVGQNGRVVAKIISNPGHYKRMIAVMEKALKEYEAKFGMIKEAEELNKEIGFKA
ncbi:MAG: DUF3467 domain-containing protein [Patescibacteria group bacterium]|nr:DUF3467 domain-containing protein [Patescibacteria group bacterium]